MIDLGCWIEDNQKWFLFFLSLSLCHIKERALFYSLLHNNFSEKRSKKNLESSDTRRTLLVSFLLRRKFTKASFFSCGYSSELFSIFYNLKRKFNWTVVKSKMLSHLVLSVINDSLKKLKEFNLLLRESYLNDRSDVFTRSLHWTNWFSPATSYLLEISIDYYFILFKQLRLGMKNYCRSNTAWLYNFLLNPETSLKLACWSCE